MARKFGNVYEKIRRKSEHEGSARLARVIPKDAGVEKLPKMKKKYYEILENQLVVGKKIKLNEHSHLRPRNSRMILMEGIVAKSLRAFRD